MLELSDIDLPEALSISSAERITIGETNDVFFCKAEFETEPVSVYIKVSKGSGSSLANERAVLERLAPTAIPVPRVIWYGSSARDVLVLEAMPGDILWDHIDPRRKSFDQGQVLPLLHAYGECLGRIHALPIEWPVGGRPRLYGFLGEEEVEDPRSQRLVSWLKSQDPPQRNHVFVHGDFNTASVLFARGCVSGVVDWEFAGSGWKEYDLAWILRARTAFLNSAAERDAILSGYRMHSSYDSDALRYCEVLNSLHFAHWCRSVEPEYTTFALGKASDLAELN